MLYRLYQANLVSFIRRKDKKKGWYIYYWTFRPKNIKYLVVDLRKRKLDALKDRAKRENENQFYICSNRCLRLSFDQAFDFEFKCPECGEIMDQEDNLGKIEEIEREIRDIEKELKGGS
jgi:transcription initiation factor TFIIE subunit alpha